MYITHYNPRSKKMRSHTKGFNLLNTLLDSYASKEQESGFAAKFIPAINTREEETAYHIEVDLPGIKKEEVSISIEDNILTISGERKTKEEVKEENYYKVESSFGSFSRSFSLPEDSNVEKINAESKNGVLEVTVPKLKKSLVDKVTKITIK